MSTERSAGGAGGSGLLRMGRLRNTRVVLAIMLGTVVALLGVVYYKSTGMNVSSTAELLQSPQVLAPCCCFSALFLLVQLQPVCACL